MSDARARLLRAKTRPVKCGDETFYISKISAACAERIVQLSNEPDEHDPYLPILLVVADAIRDESGARLYENTEEDLAELKQVDLGTLNTLQDAILSFSALEESAAPGKSPKASARRR